MSLSRRAALGTVPLVAASTIAGRARGATAPRNILCIVVDSLPAAVLGPHPRDEAGRWARAMPCLQRLASEGFVFRSAQAAHPEPGPASAAIWSARPGSESGAMRTGDALAPDLPLGMDWIAEHTPTDVFYAGRLGIPGRGSSGRVSCVFSDPQVGASGNVAVAHAVAGAVVNQPPDRRWLGVVGLQGLSLVDLAAQAWRGLERPPDLGLPERDLPPAPDRSLPDGEPPRIQAVLRDAFPVDGWSDSVWRHLAWTSERWAGEVDRLIDTLTAVLDSSAHAGNTLVIVTSAAGHPVGAHGLLGPGAPYAHTLEVPLLMRGMATGHTDALVSGLDLLPTMCDLLGAPQPPMARGYSLRPLLAEAAGPWRRSVVSEAHIDGRAIRTPEFFFVTYPGRSEMLFDVHADPAQLRNLALDAGYSATVLEHREALEHHAATLQPTAAAEAGWPEPTEDARGAQDF